MMCIDIVDWEGGCDMQNVEANVKRIVREVAEEYRLPCPLETDKEEILHLRKSRKKEKCGSEVCQVAGSHFRRFP